MKRLIAGAAALAVLLSGCADTSKQDRFRQACTDRHGFLAETRGGWFSYRVDCIVNNQITYLPGFA